MLSSPHDDEVGGFPGVIRAERAWRARQSKPLSVATGSSIRGLIVMTLWEPPVRRRARWRVHSIRRPGSLGPAASTPHR